MKWEIPFKPNSPSKDKEQYCKINAAAAKLLAVDVAVAILRTK